MNIRRAMGFVFVLFLCFFATGCFSIEQEIFLNADGSGEMVMFISVPDFPEDVAKAQPPGGGKPEDKLREMQTDLTTNLPPSVRIKEVKEVKQNGAHGFYIVVQFKQLKDIEGVMTNFGKESMKDEKSKSAPPAWLLQSEKRADGTSFLQKFSIDLSESEKKPEAKPGEPPSDFSKELEAQLRPVLYSMVKMRFVLHAPSPITDSNADIVLNRNTAVWNCSLSAFLKNKQPIEMRARF
ncbi:MAG: hypothetical protein AB1631_24605 [Acidobacteriota bacterium]